MNGLIVKQPYADLIINGKKKWELRNNTPPKHHINTDIFLLSKGFILGIMKIVDYYLPSIDELKQTNHLHHSGIYWDGQMQDTYAWIIKIIKRYDTPVRYDHPNGAQIWVLDVTKKQKKLLDYL